jgi:hypothetical protein
MGLGSDSTACVAGGASGAKRGCRGHAPIMQGGPVTTGLRQAPLGLLVQTGERQPLPVRFWVQNVSPSLPARLWILKRENFVQSFHHSEIWLLNSVQARAQPRKHRLTSVH